MGLGGLAAGRVPAADSIPGHAPLDPSTPAGTRIPHGLALSGRLNCTPSHEIILYETAPSVPFWLVGAGSNRRWPPIYGTLVGAAACRDEGREVLVGRLLHLVAQGPDAGSIWWMR